MVRILLLLILLLSRNIAFGQLISDQSFGANGKIEVVSGDKGCNLQTSTVDRSNRIISGGTEKLGPAGYRHPVIVRHLSEGSIDESFGTQGSIHFPEFPNESGVATVKILMDNSILVLFWSFNGNCYLGNYNEDGSPKLNFGVNGIRSFNLSGFQANELIILPDNKFLIGGNHFNGSDLDIGLFKLTSTFEPDSSFGEDGFIQFQVIGSYESTSSILSTSDNKIYIAGSRYKDPEKRICSIMRINSNGQIDTSFGTSGNVSVSVGMDTFGTISNIAIDSTGNIICTGYSIEPSFQSGGINRAICIKLSSTGELSADFAENGIQLFHNEGGIVLGQKVYIQPNNRILIIGVAGEAKPSYKTWGIVYRLNQSGEIDLNLNGGKILIDFSGNESNDFTDLTVDSNNHLILTGSTQNTFLYSRGAMAKFKFDQFDNIYEDHKVYLNLYPNPTSSFTNITSKELISDISIIDFSGKCYHQAKLDQSTTVLDVNLLPVGSYILSIITPSGRYFKKLMVAR